MRIILAFLFSLNIFLLSALSHADSAVVRSSVVSYKMVNLATGEVVADVNSQMAATPASVTKLITTSTALEILGPDYRFPTYLETDGFISNDTLYGNLIIRGTGDPTFGSLFCGSKSIMDSVVFAVTAKGIKVVRGDIIADPSCYNRRPVSDKWVWEDVGLHYGAGVYGINIYDNTAIYLFNSDKGGSSYISHVVNDLPYMDNVNEVRVSSSVGEILTAYSAPYSSRRFFYGSLVSGRKNISLKVSTTNPPLLAAYKLYSSLGNIGVKVTGSPREVILNSSGKASLSRPFVELSESSSPSELENINGNSEVASPAGEASADAFSFDNHTVIKTFYSLPLKDIITETNYKSNNLYAESIFRHLALTASSRNASSAQSLDIIRGFWANKGVNVKNMSLYDGCGLSPQGALPASTIVDMLVYMYNSKNYSTFLNSLPLAGKDGTVAGMLRNTPLECKVRMKSGSFSGTCAYAGYISVNGNNYAFAVMFNNFTTPSRVVKKIIEEWLVRDAR